MKCFNIRKTFYRGYGNDQQNAQNVFLAPYLQIMGLFQICWILNDLFLISMTFMHKVSFCIRYRFTCFIGFTLVADTEICFKFLQDCTPVLFMILFGFSHTGSII